MGLLLFGFSRRAFGLVVVWFLFWCSGILFTGCLAFFLCLFSIDLVFKVLSEVFVVQLG